MFTLIAAWFLADILTGIVHWWQDHYLSSSSTKILAGISKDNDLHHTHPEAMGKYSMWENVNTSAPYGLVLAVVLYYFHAPALLTMTILFASFGNLVHRFAHVPKNKIPMPIQWLQRTGIFISPLHHSKHHRNGRTLIKKEDSDIRFCPMTNLMNPMLDYIGFFKRLEQILSLFGIKPVKQL